MTPGSGVVAEPAPAQLGLGIVGRIGVIAILAAGVVAAASSAVALVTYVPYAAVGAVLTFRRPRSPIGWILIGLAWCLALLNGSSIDARPEQFANGSLGPPALLSILAHGLSLNVFLLLALLTSLLPSGRLPDGRWGRIVRIGLSVGVVNLVLSLGTPTIPFTLSGSSQSITVRNPFAVLPDLPLWTLYSWEFAFIPTFALLIGAALSLVIRYRRSFGVERQQLRWIGTSLILVVLGILAGFVLSSLVPASGTNGLAWVGAIVTFPMVPVAIGIAVLRYRLYNIDTIINRAIVYGLLTAILAGGSAAAIGVLQRLFQGIVGPGSDASIVLTTLIVVTAFNPIKTRLQAFVDKRLKEAHDPAVELGRFVQDVHQSVSSLDQERTLRRLLDVAVESYAATGGNLRTGDTTDRAIASGGAPSDASATVSAATNAGTVVIQLSGTDTSRDLRPLEVALSATLAELGMTGIATAVDRRGEVPAVERPLALNDDRSGTSKAKSSIIVSLPIDDALLTSD